MSTSKEKISGNIFDIRILSRIFAFVKPYIAKFYLLIVMTIALAVLAPTRPFLTQITIDTKVATGDIAGLTWMIAVLLALMLVQSLVQFWHTFVSNWLGQQIIRDIRVQLFKHLLSHRLRFYDQNQIGRLVTRSVSDIETLAEVFTNGMAAIVGDLLQLIVILGVMFYMDWRLTLVSLSTIPILILSTYIFKEKVKFAFNEVRTAVANLNSFVQEHITGMNIVHIFNSEKREFAKFEKINREHKISNLKTVMYYSVYFPVAEVIGATGTGLLVWFGAREVLHDQVTLGTLIAFIMYIALFFRPIRMIADRFNTLQLSIVSSDRIIKLLDAQEDIQVGGDYQVKNVEGDVRFENVWFAYDNENFVLKNISFEIKKGQTLAFVGATGAGKSSIINLLSRFYEINQGAIYLDGVEVRRYSLENLRSHIGVVLQDVFLFSDTIRQNITLGNPEITDAQIQYAAEIVGAWQFIEKLPNQLDYNVMERGATLSVGQRQLLSFVRAMVYNPKILILDEATSSVDSETEEMIQQAIERMMKGRTSIVIAHRLATIQKADSIMVLDKGEVKEIGTHDELLALNGFYAHLHEMQYKEVL